MGIPKFLEKMIPSQSVQLFVNWESSDAEIVSDFVQWVKKVRPSNAPEKLGGKKATQPDVLRARLKELGAKRLLDRMTVKEAEAHTKEILGCLPLYSGAWSRAKGNAEALLRAFREEGFPIADTGGANDPLTFLLGTSNFDLPKLFQRARAHNLAAIRPIDFRWAILRFLEETPSATFSPWGP